MATFRNTSFEQAASGRQNHDGVSFEAKYWSTRLNFTSGEYADFGDAEVIGCAERFERGWGNTDHVFEFVGVGFDHAPFIFNQGPEPKVVETFESEWGDIYDQHTRLEAATFNAGLYDEEDFESDWGNDSYLFEFDSGVLYDGVSESFESGWDNATWQDEFAPGDLDDFLLAVEDFETFVNDMFFFEIPEGTSNATWILYVVGEQVVYAANGDDEQTIVSELTSRINALLGDAHASWQTGPGYGRIRLRANETPTNETVFFATGQVENAAPEETWTKINVWDLPDTWSQRAALPYPPP